MELLKSCLKSFTIAELSRKVGMNITNSLNNFDIQITKANLSEILINNQGYSILSDTTFRRNMIEYNLPLLSQTFNDEDLKKILQSNWNNIKERVFLINSFGGSVSEENFNIESRTLLTEEFYKGENLFSYQNWMRNKLLNFLVSDKRNTLVQMPTGSGKTKTAITAIIDFIRHKSPNDITVVWLAHSDELCEQAIESFSQLWSQIGIGKCNIWRMWGGLRENNYQGKGSNFVVTSFQTAYKWLSSGDNQNFTSFLKIKNKCDLLLIDEAHMSTAPTFELVIDAIASIKTKRIGLTATPGRGSVNSDNRESIELAKYYEGNLIKMTDNEGNSVDNPVQFLQKEEILSKIKIETLEGIELSISEDEGKSIQENLEIPPHILQKIDDDHRRFLSIAQVVFEKAIIQKKQTIVFCPSKNNAILLSCFLNKLNANPTQVSASVTSEMPKWERLEKINEFKQENIKILTNFGVLTTGFDVPKIEVVVIARPTFSVVLYSQMIGRGLRGPRVGGTNEVTIVNVRDNIVNLPDVYDSSTFFNRLFDRHE